MTVKFGVALAAGFCVLATISAATGNFAVRLDAANKLAQQAQGRAPGAVAQKAATPAPVAKALPKAAPAAKPAVQTVQAVPARFMVPQIQLTQAPASQFRGFTVRSNRIGAQEGFSIYFEPTGLQTRFENGMVKASMSVDVLIRNARNETVIAQDNVWKLPLERPSQTNAPLVSVYGNLTLNPLNLPAGQYQMVLRIHDDLAGVFDDKVLAFEIAAAPAGQRLSQTQPQAASR